MFGRSILLVSIVCALLIISGCSSESRQAHDAAVEQHRQQQAAQAASAPVVAASPSPSASVAASPGQTASAQPAPSRNYWTSFRGPKRDGRYDETPVSTNWPANGLPVI